MRMKPPPVRLDAGPLDAPVAARAQAAVQHVVVARAVRRVAPHVKVAGGEGRAAGAAPEAVAVPAARDAPVGRADALADDGRAAAAARRARALAPGRRAGPPRGRVRPCGRGERRAERIGAIGGGGGGRGRRGGGARGAQVGMARWGVGDERREPVALDRRIHGRLGGLRLGVWGRRRLGQGKWLRLRVGL